MFFSACTLHSISVAVSVNAHSRMHFRSLGKPPAIVQSSKSSRGLYVVSLKGYVSFSARKERQRVCRSYYALDDSRSSRQVRHGFITLRLSVTRKIEQKDSVDNRTFSSRLLSRLYAMPEDISGDDDGRIGDGTGAGAGSGWDCRDEYGPYPWDPSWQSLEDSSFEWIHEDVITFFTTDGVVRIGGAKLPRRILRKQGGLVELLGSQRRYKEEDYMDPKQGLCLGAIFDIAATNGLDMHRRFCVFGFCRSIEMLSDVVEDTVREQGGEVVVAEKKSVGGLHEKLRMTVAMPLLWGIPPAVDSLNYAIRSGGGIVEKAYRKWEFL
ncbi:hypothetical protein O6H91_20G063000 [Diphasiastrum complanatum]|uniref:Uncharacterized protein n=4 Tax=Diphasiastrum complanatum TaxID=34168 RepID=A0ACC2AR39_DIPCM|nr:hypothetical protein O6H91_20G063000 [Diphasiastrum complanatum]KAJ7520007.1 hypothetical protein O6H91_20G063000 [Diphasiastrum complanatum]KAJ7520008.1 hypothetical protein O6H91_20G063000 [Diphasiastrum complanatum]KAJ7520009.1 hypothetical protein O6H91_20G063000 [Diphasiastrum complanatum]